MPIQHEGGWLLNDAELAVQESVAGFMDMLFQNRHELGGAMMRQAWPAGQDKPLVLFGVRKPGGEEEIVGDYMERE